MLNIFYEAYNNNNNKKNNNFCFNVIPALSLLFERFFKVFNYNLWNLLILLTYYRFMKISL